MRDDTYFFANVGVLQNSLKILGAFLQRSYSLTCMRSLQTSHVLKIPPYNLKKLPQQEQLVASMVVNRVSIVWHLLTLRCLFRIKPSRFILTFPLVPGQFDGVGLWTSASEIHERSCGSSQWWFWWLVPLRNSARIQRLLIKESGRWWGCNFYEKITSKHRKLRCVMASTCLKPR